MDILGFFDGFFTVFSAMRSGKSIDEPEINKNIDSQQANIQSTTQTCDELIRSRKEQIKSSRTSHSNSKEREYDRDRD